MKYIFLFSTFIFISITASAQVIQEDTAIVYLLVNQMPEFKGGDQAMNEFIIEKTKYPQEAIDNNIQGQVYVQFIVDKKGRRSHYKVIESPHESLSKEAKRLLKRMPKWQPGEHNGEKVNVQIVTPITFKLSK